VRTDQEKRNEDGGPSIALEMIVKIAATTELKDSTKRVCVELKDIIKRNDVGVVLTETER